MGKMFHKKTLKRLYLCSNPSYAELIKWIKNTLAPPENFWTKILGR
jgi:hypothetical protein